MATELQIYALSTCAAGVSVVNFEPLYFGHLYLFRILILGFRVYAYREPRAASNKLCKTNPILTIENED